MKKKLVEIDPNSDEYAGISLYFSMSDFHSEISFEENFSKKDVVLYTKGHPIDSIVIEGEKATSEITLHFGNYGHIHLGPNQVEAFVDGINKVYKKMTIKSYGLSCSKCGFNTTFKLRKPVLIKKIKMKNCPKCKESLWISDN